MNTLLSAQRIASTEAQSSFLRPIVKESPVLVIRSTLAPIKVLRVVGGWLVNFLLWIAKASIIRSVAPGARALERHEFESISSRRGGFGNVF